MRPRFPLAVVLAAVATTALWPAGGGDFRAPRHPAPASATTAPPLARWRWVKAGWALPEPLAGLAATVGPQGIVVAGGATAGGDSAGVYRLAGPAAGRLASLPVALHDAAAAVVGNTLYVYGGGRSVSTATVQAVPLGGGAGRLAPSLATPLSDLGAVVWNGAVYLVGGHDQGEPLPEVWKAIPPTPPRPWLSLPWGVRYAAVAEAGGTLYVAGGDTGRAPTAGVLAVDLRRRQVARLAPLPTPVAYAGATVVDGTLLVAGGKTAQGWTNATWLWDARARRWVAGPPLPQPVGDGALVTYGGNAWWLGGMTTEGPTATVWRLVPTGRSA